MNASTTQRRTSALLWTCGLAAVLGGLLLALAAGLHSLEPVGCIGPEECTIRPMRGASASTGALAGASALLLAVGLGGPVLLARRAGRGAGPAAAGFACVLGGFGVLALALVVQAVWFGGDLPWMPLFVGPGILAVLIGVVLIAVATLRARLLPRWVTVLLAASAVVALFMNEQSAAVLLVVPLAVAIATAGWFLCRAAAAGRSSAQSDPSLLPAAR